MATLSTSLLGVLAPPGTELYRKAIKSHAVALDDIQIPDQNTDLKTHVAQASKALSVLCQDSAITAQDHPEEYEKLCRLNWSSTCWLPAACFVKLKNATEAALALKIVTVFQAKFVVRSGGHSANPNFASVGEEGVVLDLGQMNDITLSTNGSVVSVGPGATWDAVYDVLEKMELTVVGGRVQGVAVGGLVTGGGMSHFSNHWGLACDQVKNFEVVLADSSIVNANAHVNADLFHALKGGGSNFGIVTRFDLHTNPDYRLWYAMKVYKSNDVDRVMQASIKVQEAMDEDDRIGFFLLVQATHLVAGMLYRGYSDTTPSAFRVFDGIEPMTTALPETNGTQLSAARALAMDEIAWRESGTVTLLPDAELYVELHKLIQRVVSDNTSSSYSLQFTFQPLGAAAAKISDQHGGNIMNLRRQNQAWLAFTAQWTDEKDADLARKQIRNLISGVEETAKKRELLLDFYFMNDSSYWQNPLKSYGKDSLDFMEKMAVKWDPEHVFQKLQNDSFLISKV